jgi:hypothetical protein
MQGEDSRKSAKFGVRHRLFFYEIRCPTPIILLQSKAALETGAKWLIPGIESVNPKKRLSYSFFLCSIIGMDQTDSRLAHSPEPASDDAASPFNPQPVEAADRLAFEPVPLRYRTDGLTPEKQRAFVEALADCGIVREAAARIGVSEQAVNRVRRRSGAGDFDRACEAAQMFGARRLRSVAYERAIEGTLKGHYYHGERVGEERVYDNRLLTYLLGKTEHLLQPPAQARAICDDWEAHMDALEHGLPPPDPSRQGRDARPEFTGREFEEDDDGIWWTGFPPPADFDGEEQGNYGDFGYRRTLSPREQEVLDAELEQELEEEWAAEADRRDRYFGFAGDEISSLGEAEPSETTEPSGEELGPIEYKSMHPPNPSPVVTGEGFQPAQSFRRKPEPMNAAVRSSRQRCSWIPERFPPPPTSKPPRPGILADEPPGATA